MPTVRVVSCRYCSISRCGSTTGGSRRLIGDEIGRMGKTAEIILF